MQEGAQWVGVGSQSRHLLTTQLCTLGSVGSAHHGFVGVYCTVCVQYLGSVLE